VLLIPEYQTEQILFILPAGLEVIFEERTMKDTSARSKRLLSGQMKMAQFET